MLYLLYRFASLIILLAKMYKKLFCVLWKVYWQITALISFVLDAKLNESVPGVVSHEKVRIAEDD